MKAAQVIGTTVINLVDVPDLLTLPGTVAITDVNGKNADIGDTWDGVTFTTPPPTILQANAVIQRQIAALEATAQSARAVREHILGVDTTRLPALQTQIVALRAQLK